MSRCAIAFAIFVLTTLAPCNGGESLYKNFQSDHELFEWGYDNRVWSFLYSKLLAELTDFATYARDLRNKIHYQDASEMRTVASRVQDQLGRIASEIKMFNHVDLLREEKFYGSHSFTTMSILKKYLEDEPIYQRNISFMVQMNSMEKRSTLRYGKLERALRDDLFKFMARDEWHTLYRLPIETACSSIPHNDAPITIDFVCTTLDKCSWYADSSPYHEIVRAAPNLYQACKDRKCYVKQAIPMMAAMIWFKVTDWMAQRLCLDQCRAAGCQVDSNYDAVLEEISKMKAYINVIPNYGGAFFEDAVQRRAYSDLDEAMSMVASDEQYFKTSSLACQLLNYADSCLVVDIYREYVSMKKIQNDRRQPARTRDLRLHANIDKAKMIELQRDTLEQIELLGTITQLDKNLRVSVDGISTYFQGLAEFEEAIAAADVAFIREKLAEFERKDATLLPKLEYDVREVMDSMLVILTSQFIEQTAILVAKIAENVHPLKVIFEGVDVASVLEQTAEVARAAEELVHGKAVADAAISLSTDSQALARAFIENAEQISHLSKVVSAITSNQAEFVGSDADSFIKEYGAYTPHVSKQQLAKNDALWAALKNAACDLLNGAEGIATGVGAAIVNGLLVCEKLEGTLAEYFTLRESTFDFQFQMVDAAARVVRGNIAKKLSASITVSNDLLKASEVMTVFFMAQNRLQSLAFLYCDILEYRQLGREVDFCWTRSGLFTMTNLENLIAYIDPSTYVDFDKYVYIPTRPQFPGDTGFISVPALAKGETIIFRLPANNTWLDEYDWSIQGGTDAFVKDFKLFLPQKKYATKHVEHTTTSITVMSIGGSKVASDSDILYVLPNTSYHNEYAEGYSRCAGEEVRNPYSLCDNLPDICEHSQSDTGTSLLPTILSTWNVTYTVKSGSTNLEWNAPSPATNLLLIAKLKLRKSSTQSKKRHAVKADSSLGDPVYGCCKGNRYRPSWRNNNCIDCPSHSSSSLKGYYCNFQVPEEA